MPGSIKKATKCGMKIFQGKVMQGGRGFKSRSRQTFFQNIFYSIKSMNIWGVHCQGSSLTLSSDKMTKCTWSSDECNTYVLLYEINSVIKRY